MVEKIQRGIQFMLECDGVTYRQFRCNGVVVFCADCAKDCNACPGEVNMIKPCEFGIITKGLYTRSCVNTYTAHYSILDFPISQKTMYPEFVSLPSISNITSTTVSVAMNVRVST